MRATLPALLVALAVGCSAGEAPRPDPSASFHHVGLALARWNGRPAPAVIARASAGARTTLERGNGVTEWYQRVPRGLEQGFEVRTPPAGETLAVDVALSGAHAAPGSDGEIELRDDAGRVVAHYGEAAAHDARGRTLTVRLLARGSGIALQVDVRGATFPVSIDPLLWVEREKIVASDGAAGDGLGQAVALSGSTALVTTQAQTGGQGAAYVFVRSGGAWSVQQELVASDASAGALFGHAAALEGDTALVGAVGAGAAYVFTRSGAAWSEQQKLPGGGDSVALSTDTAVVGDVSGDAARVFVRSGTSWTQQQTLVASDGATGDHFGAAVAVSGDTAVVGAPRATIGASSKQGAAYVFVRSGTTWTEQQKLVAADGLAGDQLGHAVAADGDTVLAGIDGFTTGGGYVFVRSGTTWTLQQKLVSSGGSAIENLGFSVALRGDTALVGARASGTFGEGVAYVFDRSGASWTQQEQLAAGDGKSGDQLGFAVALSGRTALAGAPNANIASSADQGAAYTFTLQGASCGSDAECAYCVDGTCCADACTSPCRSCVTGTCTTVVTSQDDDQCTGTHTCSAGGACLLKNGQACGQAGDCASGFCADGVCCNTACKGACDVCTQALGASAEGTCSPAPAGSAGSPACAPLLCDGTSTACPGHCASDAACAPGTYCRADATCHATLSQGAACDDAAGKDCLVAGCRECNTPGGCVDGFCCDTACDAACDVCDATPGTCSPAAAGTPGAPACSPYLCGGGGAGCATTCGTNAECAANAWCNAGACVARSQPGAPCATNEECAGDHCVDGVCCNSACDGQCEACDVAKAFGTCTPVVGVPRGSRAACDAAVPGKPCSARRCDGTQRAACAGFADSATACTTASCSDGVATLPATCNGQGSCQDVQTVKCGAYACDATACKTTCQDDTDCARDSFCDVPTHKCVAGSTCKNATTALDESGGEHDCSPYVCASGACKTACTGSVDCADNGLCDPDLHTCTRTVSTNNSSSSGCGCRIGGLPVRRGTGALAWLALLALVARRRRRRA